MTYELLIAVPPILIMLALLIKVILLQAGRGKRYPSKHVEHSADTRPSIFVPSRKADHPSAARLRHAAPSSPAPRPSITPATHSTPVGDGGFANSLMLGIATDNTLLATAIGGSLAGAMAGVALDDSMHSDEAPAPAVDACQPDTSQTSPSDAGSCCSDPAPSYDTGSSSVGVCDAGSPIDTSSNFDSGSSGSW